MADIHFLEVIKVLCFDEAWEMTVGMVVVVAVLTVVLG